MKLLYIENTSKGTNVVYDEICVSSRYSAVYEINKLCMMHLKTYEGVRLAVKRILGITSLVPIPIDEGTILVPTSSPRSYSCVWINACEVEFYEDERVHVTGGKTFEISKKRFQSFHRKTEHIRSYFQSLYML